MHLRWTGKQLITTNTILATVHTPLPMRGKRQERNQRRFIHWLPEQLRSNSLPWCCSMTPQAKAKWIKNPGGSDQTPPRLWNLFILSSSSYLSRIECWIRFSPTTWIHWPSNIKSFENLALNVSLYAAQNIQTKPKSIITVRTFNRFPHTALHALIPASWYITDEWSCLFLLP